MSEQDTWEDEEDVAVAALSAWMEVDGDDELADAQREALVAIAQEAVELKERREEESRRRARARQERLQQEARRRAEIEARAQRDEERARRRVRERLDAREQQERERRQSEARRRRHAEAQRAAEVRQRRGAEAPAHREATARPCQRVEARTISTANRPAPRPASERLRRAPISQQTRGSVQSGREAVPEPGQTNAATRTTTPAPSPVLEVSSAEPSRKPDPGERQPPTSTTDAAHLTGADLATWRKRLGLTQQAAADRLGVRQGTISKAESRARKPLGPTLHQALAVEMVSK